MHTPSQPRRSSKTGTTIAIACALAMGFASTILATASGVVPDRVEFKGQTYSAFAGLHFYDYARDRPGWMSPNSTAGYHANWQVIDDVLFLRGFSVEIPAELQEALRQHPRGIAAHWFSGVIRLIPDGPRCGQFGERELHLHLKDGVVESTTPVENEAFLRVLRKVHARKQQEGLRVFWSALERVASLHPWLESLSGTDQKERTAAVSSKQSELLIGIQKAETPPSEDLVAITAHLDGLMYKPYLERALRSIRMPQTEANKSVEATASCTGRESVEPLAFRGPLGCASLGRSADISCHWKSFKSFSSC